MGFTNAISTCFRKYVGFSGRACRSEYWWFVLFLFVIGLSAHVTDTALDGDTLVKRHDIDELSYATIRHTGPVEKVFWLVTILPFLAAGVRRMHDTGRSGLFLFAPFLLVMGLVVAGVFLGVFTSTTGGEQLGIIAAPFFVAGLVATIVTPFLLLWWFSRPSERGANRYGPNPHGVLA